jgi:hypothetical protein
MFALVIALHALWDTEAAQLIVYNIPVMPVALTVVSWLILFWMMKRGFYQVIRVQSARQAGQPPVPPEEL